MKSLLEEAPAVTQDWIVTYGDLMSLLLTFFIMLVSMSEIKENDKYQGVADSLHNKFGRRASAAGMIPGEGRPRDPQLAGPIGANREIRQRYIPIQTAQGSEPDPALRR